MAKRIAVLNLKCEWVLDWNQNNGTAQSAQIERAGKAVDDLGSVNLVAMEGGTQIKYRARFGTSQNNNGKLHPASIGKLVNTQSGLCTLPAHKFEIQYLKLDVGLGTQPC